MRLDVICNDGSPLGVTEQSIFGEDGRKGIGGAELALLTLCKGWHDKGYKVTLYNSPSVPNGSCFKQAGIDDFSPQASRDMLIIFRSPNMRIRDGAKGKKIWWSTDQRTVNDFKVFAGMVDKIVTISPYHSDYFRDVYGIFDTIPIDLPVRTWEYDRNVQKVPYLCIWNSIPDRGVLQLAEVWKRVIEQFPEARLVITSDWRLWDARAPAELLNQYRNAFIGLPNVEYYGAVNRSQLIELELQAQIHLNPNIYEELFCIAVAETQVAGAFPVSSMTGALRTTCMGKKFSGSPMDAAWQQECADYVVELLQNQKRLTRKGNKISHAARNRFSLDRILDIWDKRIFQDG